MSFEHRPSPARVTEAAAAKLPRLILFTLLVAYIVPGLFGREPWSVEDAAAFGVMWTMAHGTTADWWLPAVVGEALPEEGPLPFWLGALLIKTFGSMLGDIVAARLATIVWFALAAATLWYATYGLAHRSEAQPVALAFGGEASPRDYGRMLADIAVLLMLATFGILARLHETVAEAALFAWVCSLLLALVVNLDDEWKGTLAAGAIVGAIALTRGWLAAGTMLLVSVIVVAVHGRQRWSRAFALATVASAVYAAWPIAARHFVPAAAEPYFAALLQWNVEQVRGPNPDGLLWLLRNVGWYTWPLWPFALWTLYSWRILWRRPPVLLPLLITSAGLLNLLLAGTPSDRELIGAVPGLVVLAAFSVSTLRRAADNAIDWFSIVLFSLALLGAWTYFIAWNTGMPPKMAASVTRLVPGLDPVVEPLPTLLALAASAAWAALALWRVRVRPPMLWRGPVLAASGLTTMWVITATLYSQPMDFNRSFAPMGQVLGAQVRRIAPDACVRGYQLPVGIRAMLAFYGGLRFERTELEDACPVVIQRDSQRTQLDDAPPIGRWQLAYEATRRARYDEVFRIWVRERP